MTWQINSYWKALYDNPPAGLVLASVLTEHLGVIVEFMGEDEWAVFLSRPWNTSCVHGLTKEEAFALADELADEWRRSIKHMLDKGRLMGTLSRTAAEQIEDEVGNRGRTACNKIRDRHFGTDKPDLYLAWDGAEEDDDDDEWLVKHMAMSSFAAPINKQGFMALDYTALYDTPPF